MGSHVGLGELVVVAPNPVVPHDCIWHRNFRAQVKDHTESLMQLTAPQQQISSSTARFRVVSAGRRFGKSFLSMNEMAKFARHPNRRVMYLAVTHRQAKTVIWDDLKAQLIARNWVKKINESEMQIWLVNGSTITVRSAETKDALRGGKYDFLVLDEVADMDKDVWFSILRPTLSDRQGHALFIGTPKGLGNWFFDLWSNAKTEQDWASWQFTTLDGGNVPPEEIEAARRDLDERTFEQEYLAQFVNYAGVIFYAYTEDNILEHPGLKDGEQIHIGCDFNTSPITAGVATRTEDGLHFLDEISIYGSNTHELAEEIRRRYGFGRQIYVYPDASGGRKQTSSGGYSDHIILQNAGFKVVADSINPPVSESIASVNSLLCSSTGERRLLIDPKCRQIRESMLKYVYKDGTRQPDKDNGFDHMADCIRYVSHKLYPLRPNIISSGKSYRTVGRML